MVLWIVLAAGWAVLAGTSIFLWVRGRNTVRHLHDLLVWRADQVSMLSHELRTPLTLVKLSADLLAEEDLPDPQASFVRTIREQASTTIQLAEDLLTQARIEAGKFTPHLTTYDMAHMVLGCVSDLRELFQTPIHLDCPSTPCPVHADAVLIRQGLTNLINNAIAVSGDASVSVRLARREYDLLVSVADTGTGMDAERRLRLFQRFSSGRPIGSGTGLGLIITKQIVELHGGQLFIDTKQDQGTTVMFNLPIDGPIKEVGC